MASQQLGANSVSELYGSVWWVCGSVRGVLGALFGRSMRCMELSLRLLLYSESCAVSSQSVNPSEPPYELDKTPGDWSERPSKSLSLQSPTSSFCS
mmetsp:Transcript_3203/g.7268  ORF Transcript_3203/g.7268 Transcript_3203/m.7268 type:complete len:96 (-) Transcript_3203:609-896(-)